MSSENITKKQLTSWSKAYNASKERQLATLALSKTGLNDVSFSQNGANAMHPVFSLEIKTMPVTNQQHSGRCWLFAAANVLREKIAKDLNIDSFELSQNYLAFWDKFERCNYFLEEMIALIDLPADDRTVAFTLATGVHDGGQWDMFANIVEKYGLVPKSVYDETYQSNNTRDMNAALNRSLKACTAKLRKMYAEKATPAQLRAEKEKTLAKLYAFLCSCYGEPPAAFDFEYTDKDDKFHAMRGVTPKEFADKYVKTLMEDTVSIINAPTKDKPYHKTYTIKGLGNIKGGKPVKHLNLTMKEFKDAVIRQLKSGKVVWFGSDVGKFGERELGLWDDNSFGLSLVTGLDMEISKEDSLDLGYSAMNHAMVITGVNLVNGKPNRWKIENSWGDKNGTKGYYVCSDSWFDMYVYQAAVEKAYLGKLADLAAQEPVELDPWDPMGTLAD